MRRVIAIGLALGVLAACGSGEADSAPPENDTPASPGGSGRPHRKRPNRLAQNEDKAIEILRSIAEAQSGARYDDSIDRDQNGSGEYGYLAELSGMVPVRGEVRTRIRKTYLSRNFGRIRPTGSYGIVVYAGYCFAMFLPDENAQFLPESASGGAGAKGPDPTRAEEFWCCYAWPHKFGRTGRRVFCIDQSGDIVFYNNDEAGLQFTGRRHPISIRLAHIAFRGATMDTGLVRNGLGLNDTHWTWLP